MSSRQPQRIAATHIFLIKENRVLLSVRKNTGYRDGDYSTVGGHIEINEEIIEATIREIFEEIGVKVTQRDLNFCHVMDRLEEDERIDFFFVCEKWQGRITNMEPDKCEKLEWVDIRKLPLNTIPYIRQALECTLEKRYYSTLRTNKVGTVA